MSKYETSNNGTVYQMSTALTYLWEWADGDAWRNHVINTVMTGREIDFGKLTGEILELIHDQTRIVEPMPASDFITSEDNDKVLFLTEIKNPRNVNALADNVSFSMGKGLNVFYGENGSGKSSYVRMFRKLADNYLGRAKQLPPIFPNVFAEPQPIESPWQTVEIGYTLGNSEYHDVVDISTHHSVMSRINVFDSDSVSPLVNADLSFSVLPKGFDLFQRTATVLDSLRTELTAMITAHEGQRDILFADSSFDLVRQEVLQILTEVRSSGDVKTYLNSNFPRSDVFEESIAEIDLRIKELESTNLSDKIRILATQKSKLEAIKRSVLELCTNLSAESISKINELVGQYEQKVREEKELNEAFQQTISFLDVVNDEWITFITAGKRYYDSIQKSTANRNDVCIFCAQPLSNKSVEVVNRYLEHINRGVTSQKELIEKEIGNFRIASMLQGILDNEASLFENGKLLERIKSVVQLVNRNIDWLNRCLSNKSSVESTMVLDASDLIRDISKEIESLGGRITTLDKSRQEIVPIIDSHKAMKLTLQKSEKLHTSFDAFIQWFKFSQLIKERTAAKSKCSTTSLTQKQKDAFAAIVQSEYLDTFFRYGGRLKVSNVDIKLKPLKGTTVKKKYVASEEYRVSDIMSEGEQKAIAMTEFATDLTIRNDKNPVLFDDPVNSLDYKRSELFANLIYELSLERQILVFTHNITFYYYLYNASLKKLNNENKFFKVDEFDRMNKGIVTESFSGRLENLKQITNSLRKQGQEINTRSCVGDVLEQVLKKAYSDIRTWCELIVEEGMLKHLIRRHQPNIQFTAVPKITSDFVVELPKVYELFERACRWMAGHSQPPETQHVRATRETFNEDFSYIERLYEAFKD